MTRVMLGRWQTAWGKSSSFLKKRTKRLLLLRLRLRQG
jgi:hypothetical protein